MSVSQERASYLLQRYVDREATAEELRELTAWLGGAHRPEADVGRVHNGDGDDADERDTAMDDVFRERIEALLKEGGPDVDGVDWDLVYEGIRERAYGRTWEAAMPLQGVGEARRGWRRYAAYAAAAALMVAVGMIWLLTSRHDVGEVVVPVVVSDIAPASKRATLTLSDGTSITLDSASAGTIAVQGTSSIIKSADGGVTYRQQETAGAELLMNTMRTPKGGQYQLTLPDGTKVWLNAASSITYPASFASNERKVQITGEVYFEVARDAHSVFAVGIGDGVVVRVLGTSFNVNAYTDEEDIRATLLEGTVKVNDVMLRPAEQAVVKNTDAGDGATSPTVVAGVDVARVVAWKNGLFDLEGASMETLMRQIARWYDISIRYEGAIPRKTFHGKITRDLTLSQLLKGLEDIHIKFRLEGKTLIVEGK